MKRQVTQQCQAIASIANGVEKMAGTKRADEFVARAYDNKDLPFVTSSPIEIQALERKYGHVEDAKATATETRKQKNAALLANRTEAEIEQEEQKKAEAKLAANAIRRARYANRTEQEKEEARLAANVGMQKMRHNVDCDHCGKFIRVMEMELSTCVTT